MRTYTIVFAALAVLLVYAEYVNAMELCPQENCIVPDHCETEIKNLNTVCSQQGTLCCSIVKEEYRTHCRHFGGQCMKNCPNILSHEAVDCEDGNVCCVLV